MLKAILINYKQHFYLNPFFFNYVVFFTAKLIQPKIYLGRNRD